MWLQSRCGYLLTMLVFMVGGMILPSCRPLPIPPKALPPKAAFRKPVPPAQPVTLVPAGNLSRWRITLPNGFPLAKEPAQVAVGQGLGTMSIDHKGTIHLQAQATATGRYAVNWYQQATVFDYWLPRPVHLPPNSASLALSYDMRLAQCQGASVHLRLLVGDARGGRWAVGTRFGGVNNAINPTHGFKYVAGYPWNTSEIGRRDPWVMQSLQPRHFNEYTGPHPPLTLLGFSLIVEPQDGHTRHHVVVALRDLRSLPRGVRARPYWLLTAERIWNTRMGQPWANYGRYGWGAGAPRPFLRAADLALADGAYHFTWEILAADGWHQLAAHSGTCRVVAGGSRLKLALPLLACGSYHLHLMLRAQGAAQPRQFFFQYVVLRNAKAVGPIGSPGAGDPLQIHSSAGGNVFPATGPARLVIGSPLAGGLIKWVLAATDRTVVAQGRGPTGQPLTLNLARWRPGHAVLWLTVRLEQHGRTVDILDRTIGFTAPSGPPPPVGVAGSKLRVLAGRFIRGKGDWSEGSLPIGTFQQRYAREFSRWFHEASTMGYNTVELPAPWYEINPLPGVYQFKYLDALVAAAHQRGLYVTLRVHPAQDLTPAWVSRQLMEDQHGLADGLWGGGNTLLFSPAARSYRVALDRYLTALTAHYRGNGTVLGVTIEDLYFDHDLLDQPWLGEYVDYSPAMRRYWIRYLRHKYHGSLEALSAAWGRPCHSWRQAAMPRLRIEFDRFGRLKPRASARWRDWTACKIRAIRSFRIDALRAARRGDPRCYTALYASNTTSLYWKAIEQAHAQITYGGMEETFPPTGVSDIPGRFEPIGKVARTGTLVDVGMTNALLSAPPGFNSIFNYWMVNWRLGTQPAPVQAAERRFHQWFSVVDRLVGAAPVNVGAVRRRGVLLVSPWGLLLSMQNTFTPRLDDYLNPYNFAAARDKVRLKQVYTGQSAAHAMNGAAYVYLPYCSDVLKSSTLRHLVSYVHGGGRLVMEATSGYWTTAAQPNALLRALGLPAITVAPYSAEHPSRLSRPARWLARSPIRGVALAFRVHPFEPPINTQPVPWIQNIAGCYLRPYRLTGRLPASARVVARYADGTPAAALLHVGKGRVLLLAGVVDWLNCPGLAAAIDDWGRGRPVSTALRGNPVLIVKDYRKGHDWFAVGRRFIGQNDLGELGAGKTLKASAIRMAVRLGVPARGALRYRVHALLQGRSLGTYSATALRDQGVTLKLSPGEAFFLEAVPVKR